MNELPTIESGKIWEGRGSKELVYGIMKNKKCDYAVLRIAGQDLSVEGEILIAKSSTVNGAALLEGESGYGALKILLEVAEGTYSILDYSKCQAEAAHLEQGLKVRLNQVVNSLPNLPATLDEFNGVPVTKIRDLNPVELQQEENETTGKKKVQKIETAQEASGRGIPTPVLVTLAILVFLGLCYALWTSMPHPH